MLPRRTSLSAEKRNFLIDAISLVLWTWFWECDGRFKGCFQLSSLGIVSSPDMKSNKETLKAPKLRLDDEECNGILVNDRNESYKTHCNAERVKRRLRGD